MRILYASALTLSFALFAVSLFAFVTRRIRADGKITRTEMVWTALPAAGLAGLAVWYF